MRVVFYGTERKVGTSANMTVVAEKLSFCNPMMTVDIIDCSHENEEDAVRIMRNSDLLVLNISLTGSGLKEFCLRHSFVRENIIFLVGKYYQNTNTELKQLARQYRIVQERICTIPYNLRFQEAYENNKISAYIKHHLAAEGSWEDGEFQKQLSITINTILKFGERKGEFYYG